MPSKRGSTGRSCAPACEQNGQGASDAGLNTQPLSAGQRTSRKAIAALVLPIVGLAIAGIVLGVVVFILSAIGAALLVSHHH